MKTFTFLTFILICLTACAPQTMATGSLPNSSLTVTTAGKISTIRAETPEPASRVLLTLFGSLEVNSSACQTVYLLKPEEEREKDEDKYARTADGERMPEGLDCTFYDVVSFVELPVRGDILNPPTAPYGQVEVGGTLYFLCLSPRVWLPDDEGMYACRVTP